MSQLSTDPLLNTVLAQDSMFAGSDLPISAKFARRFFDDLEPVVSYLPKKWPFEDRLVAHFIPALTPDVFSYYGAQGPSLSKIFRKGAMESLDQELMQAVHRFLGYLWRLPPDERDESIRTQRMLDLSDIDDALMQCTVSEQDDVDAVVVLVDSIIRVRLASGRSRRWKTQRCVNVLEVCTFVFGRQKEFLEHAPMKLRPMTQRDVAIGTGLHESTVSRLTQNLQALTPQGRVSIRSLFGARLKSLESDYASSNAAQDCVRRMIANEKPWSPLSDQEIVHLLGGLGIVAARRTVAKYREKLGIPGSRMRKQVIGEGSARPPSEPGDGV